MSRGRGAWLRCATACLGLIVVVGAADVTRPAAADAATRFSLVEGSGGRSFSLVSPPSSALSLVSSTSGQGLTMKSGDIASFGASSQAYVGLGVSRPDPRGVQAQTDGGVLVADAGNRAVVRMDADGQVIWVYTAATDSALQAPVSARRLEDGRYLIADREASRVFIVDVGGKVQWQYGTTGIPGSGAGQLDTPTFADMRADGDVVICDAGNHRVVVVRAADYAAGAADLGYSAASIVWQYGTTGVSGSGVDELVWPTSAQWLTSGAGAGNVLICDEGAARVSEVRAADYEAGSGSHGFTGASLVWRCPATDDGSVRPVFALGALGGDGIVWVADAAEGDVLGVATGSASGSPTRHDVVALFGAGQPGFSGSLTAPCAVSVADDGSLAVADPAAGRVSLVGTTAGSAVAASRPLTCGRVGRKLFVSVTCTYLSVPHASIGVSVRIDGGPWTFLQGSLGGAADGTGAVASRTLLLPKLSVGRKIEYMVSMANAYRAFSPTLVSLKITYEPRGGGSGSGGGGESGASAHSNGSGAYAYPGSAGGSGQGSGGGKGGGTGSGSGVGSGSGYGSGSSLSSVGADTGSTAGGPTGAEIPDSVDKARTASGVAAVSGYRMKASGFAGGGEGGGAAADESPTSVLLVVPAGLSALGVAVLGGAVLAERRRLRAYVDYDAARPRPFPAQAGMPPPRPLPPPPLIRAGGAK